MVADPLDRLGHEDEVDARRDRSRVLHHERDELAQQALELLVDQVVALEDLDGAIDVEPGERVERLAQLRDGELGLVREVVDGQAQPGRDARVDQPLYGPRDPRRLVADALEVGDRLRDRDQQAQVARRRLAPGDDRRQVEVDLDLGLVDALLRGEHLRSDVAAEGDEGVHGARDLRLDHAAHLEDARGDAAQLGVELGGEMAIAHDGVPQSGR